MARSSGRAIARHLGEPATPSGPAGENAKPRSVSSTLGQPQQLPGEMRADNPYPNATWTDSDPSVSACNHSYTTGTVMSTTKQACQRLRRDGGKLRRKERRGRMVAEHPVWGIAVTRRTLMAAALAGILLAAVGGACSSIRTIKTQRALPHYSASVEDTQGQQGQPAVNQVDPGTTDPTTVAPVEIPLGALQTASATRIAARRPGRAAAGTNSPSSNQSNSWAVLIGISHYQGNTEPTYGGDGDVAVFQSLLQQAGWAGSHILVLTEGAATAAGIRSAMSWLVNHSSPDSFTLFHYSGHVCEQGRGPCGGNEKYLWGADNVLISDVEFGQTMRGLRGWSWIDVAGCEAGAFDQSLSSSQRLVTGSSMSNETSYEYPPWHESVWTGTLVDQGMLQGGAASGPGPISIQHAVAWAKQRVADMTSGQSAGVQHPYANGGTGDWYLDSTAPAQQGGQPGGPPPPPPSSAPPSTSPTSAPPSRCGWVPYGVIHC